MNAFSRNAPNIPLKIQDNTFRDGHQSLLATRMRTEDMLPVAEKMDQIGFRAMEVWGGGVQAVLNVLFGRYKMVTNEVKDLAAFMGGLPFPSIWRSRSR